MKETWKWIPGYEGHYKASDLGRIWSVPRQRKGWTTRLPGRILRPFQTSKRNRYPRVTLSKDGVCKFILVHQLVLLTFVGPCPKGMECCHSPDPDVSNNRLSNLRWGTPQANADDRDYHGRTAKGWRSSTTATGTEKRQAIYDLHHTCGYSTEKLARVFARSVESIQHLLTKT